MKTLDIVLCDDGKTVERDLRDPEIARYLKVNDLNTGQLLKAVGPHIVKRQFYYRGAIGNLESDQLPDGGVQQPLVGGAPLDDNVAKYQNINRSLSLTMMPLRSSTNSKSAQNHRTLLLPPLLLSLWIWANQTFV